MKPPLRLLLGLAAVPFPLCAETHPEAQGGGGSMAEIAKKLNNPVASLINVPFQSNFDFGGGPDDDGYQYKLNFEPVIPIRLNDDWKIISRTIIPFIDQQDRIGNDTQTGLGDVAASFFVSPLHEPPGAPVWGLGPIIMLPTATDDLLGTEKWCAGPTFLVLKQEHGWTYGMLGSHAWSFAGEDDRGYVSLTSLQPFLSHTTPAHTTYGVNLESTYDWNAEEWTVPINLQISQLVKFGQLPVNFQLGGRWYADKPSGGPDWGLRFTATFVIPE
ncbi:transporter [Luteolibacter yonseiensis]|uniref:Transporter n=1 Tax=Luteolibacter yonseiensis TaxID=1144680 RepID=A0A934VA79_9BACT|nr:transporter [Luteolibacter yonseiensis]MBK1814089.1 transporter [Luteolibacter yonseiensis]